MEKYAVGQPVLRTEDPKILVRGAGCYTDDVSLPGQAYAVIVRSRHAHGVIRKIDTAPAWALPGVLGVYTGADLKSYDTLKCIVPFNNRDGSPMKKPARPALPLDKVRYVGDPIAFVVAETLLQAKDAAEAVEVDVEPLPAVTSAEDAARPGAPQLYDDAPGNLSLDYHYGDADAVKAAFEKAAHVTRLKLINSRVVVNAMEPRAAVAAYDGKRFTLHVGSQGVFGLRNNIAQALKVEPKDVHLLTGQVGGSFGMKGAVFPEYVCVLHAARALGRPVKWTDERSTSFVSDSHGRDHDVTAELALAADGTFLAIRIESFGNMGAFLSAVAPMPATVNTMKNVQSLYRTPLIEVSTKCMFTNTSHVSAYRGAGRPEGNYYMERLVDTAAAEMGIDRLELRKRNQIKPRDLPYKTASAMTYDSGDFPALTRQALELADAKGFGKRKRESKKRGKVRGLGIGSFLEVTAPPSKELGDITFNADGTVTLTTGTLDFGMGHATPFAQVLSERLGVPFEKIRLVQGDSDLVTMGGGSGGSKSIMHSGTAIVEASAKVIEQGKQIASHVLEAAVVRHRVRARALRHRRHRPRDRHHGAGGEAAQRAIAAAGRAEIARRQARQRRARRLDLPQRLSRRRGRDRSRDRRDRGGEIFLRQRFRHHHQSDDRQRPDARRRGAGHRPGADGDDGLRCRGPAPHRLVPRLRHAARRGRADASRWATIRRRRPPIVLGVKGCGEAGCAGSLTSLMNAVVDALSEYGIRHIDMPATPLRVWEAIRAAKATRPQ